MPEEALYFLDRLFRRRRKGESMKAFARRIGASPVTLARWKETKAIRRSTALGLAKKLGLTQGNGKRLLAAGGDDLLVDIDRLRCVASYAGLSDTSMGTAVALRAATIIFSMLCSKGVDSEVRAVSKQSVTVSAQAGNRRRMVHLDVVDKSLYYFLTEGDKGDEAVCALGDFDRSGLNYCVEFMSTPDKTRGTWYGGSLSPESQMSRMAVD